jgi:hypothetical protein
VSPLGLQAAYPGSRLSLATDGAAASHIDVLDPIHDLPLPLSTKISDNVFLERNVHDTPLRES